LTRGRHRLFDRSPRAVSSPRMAGVCHSQVAPLADRDRRGVIISGRCECYCSVPSQAQSRSVVRPHRSGQPRLPELTTTPLSPSSHWSLWSSNHRAGYDAGGVTRACAFGSAPRISAERGRKLLENSASYLCVSSDLSSSLRGDTKSSRKTSRISRWLLFLRYPRAIRAALQLGISISGKRFSRPRHGLVVMDDPSCGLLQPASRVRVFIS